MNTLFLEPLDVLFLRGNKLFGDPGSYGESLVPPWPSVAAGALRSRMLVDAGIDPAAFARGTIAHPELGSPTTPGAFAITAFHLGRRHADGRVEVLFQPPADLVISERDNGPLTVRALFPTQLHAGEGRNIHCSAPLPKLPVLAERERGKPTSGYWLTEGGWEKYLKGNIPDAADLVKSSALWSSDHRVGVGLEAETRRAAEGRLFSVQAVAMKAGVGFWSPRKKAPCRWRARCAWAATAAPPPSGRSRSNCRNRITRPLRMPGDAASCSPLLGSSAPAGCPMGPNRRLRAGTARFASSLRAFLAGSSPPPCRASRSSPAGTWRTGGPKRSFVISCGTQQSQ